MKTCDKCSIFFRDSFNFQRHMDRTHKGSTTDKKTQLLLNNKFPLGDKVITTVTIEKGEIIVSILKRRPTGSFTAPIHTSSGSTRSGVRLSLPQFQKLIEHVPSMAKVMSKLRKSSRKLAQRHSIDQPTLFSQNNSVIASCVPREYHKNTAVKQQAYGNSANASIPRKTILLDKPLPFLDKPLPNSSKKRRGRPPTRKI